MDLRWKSVNSRGEEGGGGGNIKKEEQRNQTTRVIHFDLGTIYSIYRTLCRTCTVFIKIGEERLLLLVYIIYSSLPDCL